MPLPGIKTHKPTGTIPWPLILLEGDEKAGKSWAIAEFSKSERTGTLYWLDLNEGAAEEYGAIPGADYEVIEHDGSYQALLRIVETVKAEAQRAKDAGEPPVVFAIDSGSAIWNGLKDWASSRARKMDSNKRKLAANPDAEVTITSNLWNDSGSRWRKIQTHLATFPGIVVITARGKEVAVMGANGQPVEGEKTWSVDCHKELPYTATVWVRMFRDKLPEVIGARSVHTGVKPGSDDPQPIKDSAAEGRLVEWIVFDALKVDPATAHVRDYQEFHGGELMAHEKVDGSTGREQTGPPKPPKPTVKQATARIRALTDPGDPLTEVWRVLNVHGMLGMESEVEGYTLEELLRGRKEHLLTAAANAEADKPNEFAGSAQGGGQLAPDEQATARQAALQGAWDTAPRPAAAAGPSAPDTGDGPDDPDLCRITPARRGILSSLQQMPGGDDDALAAHFGRPLNQIGTKRLRDHVAYLIASAKQTAAAS